jgi:WD40 repeat protein
MSDVTKCKAIAIVFVLAPLLFWRAGAAGQDASPPPQAKKEVDEKAIRALIADLGDESFVKREAANKALAAMGRPALPLLRKTAAEAADLEVRERASQLVRTIANTPGPAVVFPGGSVREIAISKDGQTMIFGCEDKVVSVYDVKTMALRHTLRDHDRGVWTVAISPDGKTLASGAGEFNNKGSGDIILWDLAKGVALRTLKGHQGSALSLAFSPDGKSLYSGGFEGTVRVWEPETGKEVAVLSGHKGFVRRVHATPDGKFILSCGLDSTIRFWNRETLQEVKQMVTKRHDGFGTSTISPDGKWFITASRPSFEPDPAIITVWDVAAGKEKTTINGPTRKVGGLAVSPDNKLLAMGGGWTNEFGEVKIFELATGKELANFLDHREWIGGMAFTPDGRWLASGSGFAGKAAEVRIWDMKTMRGKGE